MFRDLDHEPNLKDGLTFHPAGVVDQVFNEEPTFAGKDLSVTFFDPFELTVGNYWRTYKDVELFEVDAQTHKNAVETLRNIEYLLR